MPFIQRSIGSPAAQRDRAQRRNARAEPAFQAAAEKEPQQHEFRKMSRLSHHGLHLIIKVNPFLLRQLFKIRPDHLQNAAG